MVSRDCLEQVSRGDDLGEAADLGEEHVGQLAEVKGVAEDRDAGLARIT